MRTQGRAVMAGYVPEVSSSPRSQVTLAEPHTRRHVPLALEPDMSSTGKKNITSTGKCQRRAVSVTLVPRRGGRMPASPGQGPHSRGWIAAPAPVGETPPELQRLSWVTSWLGSRKAAGMARRRAAGISRPPVLPSARRRVQFWKRLFRLPHVEGCTATEDWQGL